jgi:GH24 family phage-related lysozyme (muramidase)
MKIIITENQFNHLLKEGIADDTVLRDTIKGFESTVVDSSGNHYVFDDKDPKNPKTFVNSTSKKKGGTLTIGWGHTGSEAKIGNKITKSKAEQLLTSDITKEENKTIGLFPKYNSYPLYVKRALVNAVYRGEAKSSYEWVKAINAGKWETAATKYLEGWNIDFSKANDPRYKGGVADRMVTNQNAFKKYAKELKGGVTSKSTTKTSTTTSSSIVGSNVYPKKTTDSDYANVRTEPQVNNGWINNLISTVYSPDLIGKVEKTQKGVDGKTWYYVKLADGVSWFHSHGWVRSDVVKK